MKNHLQPVTARANSSIRKSSNCGCVSPAKQTKKYSKGAKARIQWYKSHDEKLLKEYIDTGKKTGEYGTADQIKRLETMNKIPDRIEKIEQAQRAKGRTRDRTPRG
jgi:hypothetical protein